MGVAEDFLVMIFLTFPVLDCLRILSALDLFVETFYFLPKISLLTLSLSHFITHFIVHPVSHLFMFTHIFLLLHSPIPFPSSFSRSFTPSITHLLLHSLRLSFVRSLITFCQSLIHLFIYTLPPFPTHSLTHSFIHSGTRI